MAKAKTKNETVPMTKNVNGIDIPLTKEEEAEVLKQWAANKDILNTPEVIISNRINAYKKESDPLKIEAEYDALIKGTKPNYKLWKAKVAEIKKRYPLPTEK